LIDLDAYLERIAYGGPLEPTRDVLDALIVAHAAHVPFENLDIQLGRPIRLDLESLEAKLVRGGRGGYCFEQNSLFAAALRAIGFEVELMEARVRLGAAAPLPRSHLTLRVHLPDGDVLADVGFGASGPLSAVPWDGNAVTRHGETLRLASEGPRRVLQRKVKEGWADLYAVEAQPPYPIDLEVANHYTSTHPESRFVLTLTAQLATPEARHVLRNRGYTVTRGEVTEEREISSRAELLDLLRSVYRLDFPPDTVFRNPVFE
jgi:N-hydroxyarylamine O-acetyltransferase